MIKDPLVIFSSIDEMKETETWLKYQLFASFDKPDTMQEVVLWSLPETMRNNIKDIIKPVFKSDTLNSRTDSLSIEEINGILKKIPEDKFNIVKMAEKTDRSAKYPVKYPVNFIINKIKQRPDLLIFDIPGNLFGTTTNTKYSQYIHSIINSDLVYDHCAISSLHTVKYLIYTLNGKSAIKPSTAYKLVNAGYKEYGTPGYFTLKKIKNKTNKLSCFQENEQAQYETSMHKFINKKNMDTFTYNLLGKADSMNNTRLDIPLYNIDFHNHILYYNKFLNSVYTKSFKNHTIQINRFEQTMKKYQNISYAKKSLCYCKNPDINNEIKIDYLLLQYQLERFFNASLFEELFKHHSSLENFNAKLLLKFSLLPNAFSRNKYVQIAFNMIGEEYIFNNYKNIPPESSRQIATSFEMVLSRVPYKTPVSLEAEWKTNTEFAIDFLSKVYFPFYEKYFFIYLYKLCGSQTDEPLDILSEMEKHLYQYCVDIYDTLDIPGNVPGISTEPVSKSFYLEMLNKLMQEKDLYSRYKITYSQDYFTINSKEKKMYDSTSKHLYGKEIKYLKILSILESFNKDKELD